MQLFIIQHKQAFCVRSGWGGGGGCLRSSGWLFPGLSITHAIISERLCRLPSSDLSILPAFVFMPHFNPCITFQTSTAFPSAQGHGSSEVKLLLDSPSACSHFCVVVSAILVSVVQLSAITLITYMCK